MRLGKFVLFKNCFQVPVDWEIDGELGKDLVWARRRYDPVSHRLLGNFPQAFSHLGLVNSALKLTSALNQRTETEPLTKPMVAA